jgi:hypothetical protein
MTQGTASNYKLCYSGNIQKLFGMLRKQNGDGGSSDADAILSTDVSESLAALEMTLKRWKTPTGFYTVLKYVKSPLQTMYSAPNVTQQLAQDLVYADTDADAAIPNATIQGRGLFRSIVINDVGNIVAFSPPKTITFNHLTDSSTLDQSLSLTSAFEMEEFVEGTMINLFYNQDVTAAKSSSDSSASQVIAGWEMSTKGAVGGTIFVPAPNNPNASKSKVVSEENIEMMTEVAPKKDTFRALFLDACIENGIEFDKLDTRYCYSLVLQHPKNPLICHISKPRVYLIAVYSIDNETLTVTRHPRSAIDWKTIGFIIPRSYDRSVAASAVDTAATTATTATTAAQFQTVCARYADPSGSTPYRIMGVVFNARNGAGWSFKLRNPTYETAKRTPNESGKRHLFEYCNLRRTRDISMHLKQFPDDETIFKGFQSRIVTYTQLLYSSYIECFITRKQPLIDYAAHLRTHMFRIHNDIYKPRRLAAAYTRDTKIKFGVKFQDVVQYVNLVMTPTELFNALTV